MMVSLQEISCQLLKCADLYQDYKIQHDLLITQLESFVNIFESLPALALSSSYSSFSGAGMDLRNEVLGAQLLVLERTWRNILQTMYVHAEISTTSATCCDAPFTHGCCWTELMS
jgi:hypothetical protein